MAEHPRIALDPDVLAGKPVIRGTRLAVEFVIACLPTAGLRRRSSPITPALRMKAPRLPRLCARRLEFGEGLSERCVR
jgi:hypothetical protein